MAETTEDKNIDKAQNTNDARKQLRRSPLKKWFCIGGAIVASPFILVLLFAVALYLPPVQNWAVHTAGRMASEETGMDIRVGSVHLAFPLDFEMQDVHCSKPNDSITNLRDTIAEIGRAVVDVKLMPLLDSEVMVNGMELTDAKINTADFVHEARVKGTVGRLGLYKGKGGGDQSPAYVSLDRSTVNLCMAELDRAHLDIALSDTVPEDTAKTETVWRIHLDDLSVSKSDVLLHMPGDTLQVGIAMGDVKAHNGDFDLKKKLYQLETLRMKECAVAYDNNFMPRAAGGFDANHISLSDIRLSLDSLDFWQGDTLLPGNKGNMTARLRLTECAMKEQNSGIELRKLTAALLLDSTRFDLDAAAATPGSRLAARVNYVAPQSPLAIDGLPNGWLDAKIDASVGPQEMVAFALAGMPQSFRNAWPQQPLYIKGEMHGDVNGATIPELTIDMPSAFALEAKGEAKSYMKLADDVFHPDFSAMLHADLKTYNMNFVKAMLDKATQKMINIPAMHALADVNIHGADYDIDFKGGPVESRRQPVGNVTAKANVNLNAMRYDAALKANALNLGLFVRGMQLGTFTGEATAKGQGTDILSKATTMVAHANVKHFGYQRYDLNNIKADATIKNGMVNAEIDSHNSLMMGNMKVNAEMSTKEAKGTLMADVRNIDLYTLRLADNPLNFGLCGHVDLESDLKDYYKVQGLVSDITIKDTLHTFRPDDIVLDLLTNTDTTTMHAYCGDFEAKLNAEGGYKWLMGCSDKLMEVVRSQMETRTIDQTQLREALPKISLFLSSGPDNPMARIIKYYGIDFNTIYVTMDASREQGINGKARMSHLATQGYRLDSLDFTVKSKSDPNDITYTGHILNVEPNDYVFEAFVDGKVLEHGVSLNTRLFDNKHKEALRLGAEATMEAEGIKLHLTPAKPILGYEAFKLNSDNYVMLERNGKVHADVNLLSDAGTGIKIYCTDNDEEEKEDGEESASHTLQDLTMSINKLNIGKVVATIPYAPRVEGMMDGDFHFVQNADQSFAVSTVMNINRMKYEGCDIGNLGTEMVYMPLEDGSHYVDGFVTMDDKEVATIKGSYNMETEAVNANISCQHFPLQIANGFVPQQIIGLEGFADGELAVTGTTATPKVDGELLLQDASLLSVPYGVKMRFDDDPVRIQDSRLLLENFQMYASNNQPMVCMGYVDFSNTEHINMNLRMRAKNFQVIDAKQTRRSEAYGKAFVNFYCMMSGELDKLQVRGKLDLLPSTDLYYILKDSPLTTDNRLKELVTFTDFSDTTYTTTVKPVVDGMKVDLSIAINEGAHATCWLNANHTNYLDVIGGGDLRMIYTAEEMKLNGRYTISEGEMKYALPIIPLKTFTIAPDSYIEFTGDMMNPRLNITATEQTKSAVTLDGANIKDQMIMFNCGVVITKTLNDMGLQFIIDAPENQTISDFLSMRSLEERGKIAVTMLTTGMFLTDGNTAGFSMNSALNTFLQSEINRLAGSALKTMDLSFGMDNSTEEDGTMHTNYTFKFAKRFWNNRISISIGGKVSTGPDVSGQNKSFFDNAELQYRLSDTSNQYLHMSYKNSVYDYLEGYVSQYSGGYMYKKKMQSLKELFGGTAATTGMNGMRGTMTGQTGAPTYGMRGTSSYGTVTAPVAAPADTVRKVEKK